MDSGRDARRKRFATYRYHAVRVLVFVGACVCAVAGMLMLTVTSDQQVRAQTVTNAATRAESQADVLLVMSYDDTDPTTTLERSGVLDIMNRSSVAVDVEYLDAIRCRPGTDAHDVWARALESKLASRSYNAVICADDEALSFVEDRHDDLFANMPVVFLGVNDRDHAEAAALSGYAAGIVERSDVEGIVRLARQLRPSATKCLAVVDDTASGQGDRAQLERAVAAVGGVDMEFADASAMTRDELAQRLAAAGEGEIVFFLDAFCDADGNAFTRDASARFVSEACPQPVFGIATGGVGQGLVGSGFTDPEADGQRAAELCVQVLNGTSPGTMDLDVRGGNGFVFDAVAMREHGLPVDSLPSDAVLINESAITWDTIRPMLLPIALILLGVLLILAFAFLGYRHSIRDTREIIAQRNDLRHRFYHDQLTDKPNAQWLNELVADDAQSQKVASVVAVDFVDFSDINDSYGRTAGDQVITEFSERFDSLQKEFLVRSMGAEFLLGLGHEVAPGDKDLARIEALISQPVAIDGGEVEVEAHIGIANREPGMTLKDMVAGVDMAVRNSKKAGSGRVVMFYNEGMKRDMEDKIDITALLKQSIKEESFVILYQPQVDVATNEVCGYEALVRLKGNPYYPSQFIPVAEMSGLVVDVDRIVTKKVVQQLATWKKRHKRLAPVSINYSAVQLKDEGYVDFMLDLLRENDIAPSFVKIEITESLLMDDADKAEELFARLEREGVLMALDDFGTGYTSLSRVSTIPAQVVKIDKSLVDAYLVPGKEAFLDNLVRLVHSLDKMVIVEGVETAEQLEICRQLGCDVVQGYYFSKPELPERAVQYRPPA